MENYIYFGSAPHPNNWGSIIPYTPGKQPGGPKSPLLTGHLSRKTTKTDPSDADLSKTSWILKELVTFGSSPGNV